MSDTEDAFRDESGRLLLSRTAVSEIDERLWLEYQDFVGLDMSVYNTHRRATQTTNSLECLFAEERRRQFVVCVMGPSRWRSRERC